MCTSLVSPWLHIVSSLLQLSLYCACAAAVRVHLPRPFAGVKQDQFSENQAKVLETVATLSELETDNWRHDTNSTASGSQAGLNFRESLIQYYGIDNSNRNQYMCMVTDLILSSESILAGHIISKKNGERARSRFGFDDVNDPRNGILWCKPIEAAWSCNKICFAFDSGEQFVVRASVP